jgi:hypothetical protein
MIYYSIKWTQPYTNWQPVELPITDFTQALAVIQKIKARL